MPSAFDGRLMRLTLQLGARTVTFDQGFSIQASGRIFASDLPGTLEVRIFNLTRQNQNDVLTLGSPYVGSGRKRQAISVSLDIGRESYGLFRVFEGFAYQCGMTQPPDVGIALTAVTNNLIASTIASISLPASSTLREIAQRVADANKMTLDFQSTRGDKRIGNWSVSGSLQDQIRSLQLAGGVDAIPFLSTLIVLDPKQTNGDAPVLVSADTGMVGIPMTTARGVYVRTMIDPAIRIGGGVKVDSKLNPSANGTYKVYQMSFEAASREPPFWYNLACSDRPLYAGLDG